MGNKIRLGDKVKDSLTVFFGVADARCEYLFSEATIRVISSVLENGKPVEQWFPESRLEVVE